MPASIIAADTLVPPMPSVGLGVVATIPSVGLGVVATIPSVALAHSLIKSRTVPLLGIIGRTCSW